MLDDTYGYEEIIWSVGEKTKENPTLVEDEDEDPMKYSSSSSHKEEEEEEEHVSSIQEARKKEETRRRTWHYHHLVHVISVMSCSITSHHMPHYYCRLCNYLFEMYYNLKKS